MAIRAVVLDWRGTLATTLSSAEWVREALRSLGRDATSLLLPPLRGVDDRRLDKVLALCT